MKEDIVYILALMGYNFVKQKDEDYKYFCPFNGSIEVTDDYFYVYSGLFDEILFFNEMSVSEVIFEIENRLNLLKSSILVTLDYHSKRTLFKQLLNLMLTTASVETMLNDKVIFKSNGYDINLTFFDIDRMIGFYIIVEKDEEKIYRLNIYDGTLMDGEDIHKTIKKIVEKGK
jgi:hypothetical protein